MSEKGLDETGFRRQKRFVAREEQEESQDFQKLRADLKALLVGGAITEREGQIFACHASGTNLDAFNMSPSERGRILEEVGKKLEVEKKLKEHP